MPMSATRTRATLALFSALALVATVAVASPASAASPTACRVKNLDTGVTKSNLQKAVKAAKGGHRLTVKGTCKGTTILGKNLSITGVRTPKSGAPTLDGAAQGTVVTIKQGANVTMSKVTIQGGGTPVISSLSSMAALEYEGDGGGIFNAGTLTLRNVVVRSNTANQGAGAWNQGKLTLLGSTAIRGNAGHFGAGIYNYARAGTQFRGNLIMKDSSSIRGNDSIERSDAPGVSGRAAGVWNDGATLTMKSRSSIRSNVAVNPGGGLVRDNDSTQSGVTCGPAGRVRDNLPDDCVNL